MTAEPRVMVGYLATCPSPQEVVAKLRQEVIHLRTRVRELEAALELVTAFYADVNDGRRVRHGGIE